MANGVETDRECLFEKAEMWVNEKEKDSNEDSDVDKKKEKKQNDKRVGECLIIGQEAAHVRFPSYSQTRPTHANCNHQRCLGF